MKKILGINEESTINNNVKNNTSLQYKNRNIMNNFLNTKISIPLHIVHVKQNE